MQIAEIVKPLSVKDNLDYYYIWLLDEYKELEEMVSFFVVYFDYQCHADNGDVVGYKRELRWSYTYDKNNKYYDKKASVTIGKHRVGEIKEGFDFISETKTPLEVQAMRAKASTVEEESRIFEEKVLLYRKHVTIDDVALAENADYPMRGINEIMRLHLTRFTHKMDNPEVPVDTVDEQGNLKSIKVQKLYYVNIIFQLEHDGRTTYHHFRIAMTRDGVLDITELK